MLATEALWIVPLSFFAFLLKSVAAFGPGVVLVPLGALLVDAKEVVVLVGLLDLISNTALLWASPSRSHRRLLLPMALLMIAGSALGAALLVFLPQQFFSWVLGALLVPLGVWFMIAQADLSQRSLQARLPETATGRDLIMSAIAGCMGGLAGITGPVLAWHLGRRYTKEVFRQVMIPVLFASALVRTGVYAGAGLVTSQVAVLVLLAVPGLLLGLWVGNQLFKQLSQQWFKRIVGTLIALSGIRLLSR